jgi:ubiquinone/menaquinone biosynthesis C-methylase UbiE
LEAGTSDGAAAPGGAPAAGTAPPSPAPSPLPKTTSLPVPARRAPHVRAVYERAARGYDRYYRRAWLAAAGGDAERALLARAIPTIAALDDPRVLDAGAGTGALSRELATALPAIHPVLVDLSPAMLARAQDLDDPRAVASLGALPFQDGQFDVVLCAWVIETVDDPRAVVCELLRVLRPGGLLLYSFCSRPVARASRWRSGLLRATVHTVFAGHFLTEAQIPFHDCEFSSRTSFAGGAVTLVALGTCCTLA